MNLPTITRPSAPTGPGSGSRLWSATRGFRPVLLLVVVMLVSFTFVDSTFLTRANLDNLLTSEAILWLVAMGMTFVLLSGGFDLSAGAVAAIAGVALAKLLSAGVPGPLAVLLTILFGAAVGGGVNGLLVGRFRLSVFVVTLASMTTLTGLVDLWTNAQTFSVQSSFVSGLDLDHFLGVPVLVWVMVVAFLVARFVQSQTYFGRDVFAVGGSPVAARLSGIRSSRVLFAVYAIVGGCAALGGVIAAGMIGGTSPQVDDTLPLQAIAAVLLGGTKLTGGDGGVGGTVFGVLFIGILQNGLSLAGISSFWQQVITGVILVAAVAGDRFGGLGHLTRRRATPGSPDEPAD
jgi:ribose transport system permease protein